MLVEGDNKAFSECEFVSGISDNVISRLEKYNGVKGTTLYPPLPLGGQYRQEPHENYILSVGRICGIKRVDLMVKALPMVHEFVTLKIVGQPDEPGILDYLQNEIAKHHLSHRIEFLGRVSDEELLSLYAKSLAVYYAPFNEDYGYVTLEAMASGKPVVAGNDSGGVLEFVTNEVNGLVVDPTLDGISRGFNRLIEDAELRDRMGAKAKLQIEEWGLNDPGRWDHVIDSLLSPLEKEGAASKKSVLNK